jgi:hypothetical protein
MLKGMKLMGDLLDINSGENIMPSKFNPDAYTPDLPYNKGSKVIERSAQTPMAENTNNVTQKDLDSLKANLEQKIDFNQQLLTQKIESSQQLTNQRFDSLDKNLDQRFENQFLKVEKLLNNKYEEQRKEQEADRKQRAKDKADTTKWFIGTIVFGIVGFALTIIFH